MITLLHVVFKVPLQTAIPFGIVGDIGLILLVVYGG